MNTEKQSTEETIPTTAKVVVTNKKTYLEKVVEKLSSLKLNESFSKESFVEENWGRSSYFQIRSFDVYYSKAKRLIPNKLFDLKKGIITRTK